MPAGSRASHPVADSAAAARERYRTALGLARSGDLAQAIAVARTASEAWPTQPAYHSLVASLAARAADTALAVAELDRLAELEASHPVDRDPDFSGIRGAPAVQAAVARMARQVRAIVGSTVSITMADPDFFPEGLAIGPEGSLYLGSIRHRRVIRRYPDGRELDLVPAGDSVWAVSGMALSPDGQSLWITSNAISQMEGFHPERAGRAELVRLALDGGGVLGRFPIPASSGEVMLGDLMVTPDGIVFATGSLGSGVWRLMPGTASPSLVARHPLLRSPQGVVLSRNGTTLLVADYSHGLLRVEPGSGEVTPLAGPDGVSLLGIDGLARHGRDLIAIQNGGVVPRVIRIRLDDAEERVQAVEVLDRNFPPADEPTLGVVVGDRFFYVANSQWEKRREDGTPLPGATLAPTIILGLPLPPPL